MTAMAPPPVGGWQVTGQREDQQLPPGAQNFVKGQTITFTTGYGVVGTVFIPYNQYTAANVSAAIAARVAQLDQVSALTHQSGT